MNKQETESVVRIKIVGVGGGGENAVERMLETSIPMVNYVTINTDNDAMKTSHAETKLQIGHKEAKGYGAGANPEIGFRSAKESSREIKEVIKDCDMLFITSGMGGGTGTGAAPVVAEIAKSLGILTIGVVTTPFSFEGKKRMDNAKQGIAKLKEHVDALITIPNDNIKHVVDTKITLNNAFALVDDVLVQTVKNLVEVIQSTAYINCDFADISSIVENSGDMHTATGIACGKNRTERIVEQIKTSALLGSSVNDATGIMICITASDEVGLEEIDKITSEISSLASTEANIVFGMNFDESMGDDLKTVLIATKK